MPEPFTDTVGRRWARSPVFRSDNVTWATGIGGRWLTLGSDADGEPCVVSAHLAPVALYEHAIRDWRSSHAEID